MTKTITKKMTNMIEDEESDNDVQALPVERSSAKTILVTKLLIGINVF